MTSPAKPIDVHINAQVEFGDYTAIEKQVAASILDRLGVSVSKDATVKDIYNKMLESIAFPENRYLEQMLGRSERVVPVPSDASAEYLNNIEKLYEHKTVGAWHLRYAELCSDSLKKWPDEVVTDPGAIVSVGPVYGRMSWAGYGTKSNTLCERAMREALKNQHEEEETQMHYAKVKDSLEDKTYVVEELGEVLRSPGKRMTGGGSNAGGNVFMFDIDLNRDYFKSRFEFAAYMIERLPRTGLHWGGYETKSGGQRVFLRWSQACGGTWSPGDYQTRWYALARLLNENLPMAPVDPHGGPDQWFRTPDVGVEYALGGTYFGDLEQVPMGDSAFNRDLNARRQQYPAGSWNSASLGKRFTLTPNELNKHMNDSHLVNTVRRVEMNWCRFKKKWPAQCEGAEIAFAFPVYPELLAEVDRRGIHHRLAHQPLTKTQTAEELLTYRGPSNVVALLPLESVIRDVVFKNGHVIRTYDKQHVHALQDLRIVFENGAEYSACGREYEQAQRVLRKMYGPAMCHHLPNPGKYNIGNPCGEIPLGPFDEAPVRVYGRTDPYMDAIANYFKDTPAEARPSEALVKKLRQALKTVCFGLWLNDTTSFDGMVPAAMALLVDQTKGAHENPFLEHKRAGWVEEAFAHAPLAVLGVGPVWYVIGNEKVLSPGHQSEAAAEDFRQWLLAQCRARVEGPTSSMVAKEDMLPAHIAKQRSKTERRVVPVDQHIPGEWD